MIKVEKLGKKFGKQWIFRNLNFEISEGKIVGLLGENGIGKTTLLRTISGLLKADEGRVDIYNTINDPTDIQKIAYTADSKKVAYLLDPSHIFDWMKVKDILSYYKDFFVDFDYEKALRLCTEYNINPNNKIVKLSKGNKERVCFLVNISRNVPLYLLDEPMAGFDPKFKKEMMQMLVQNMNEYSVIIIATHLLKDMETLFDEVIIMKKDGIMIESTDEIREVRKQSLDSFYMEVVDYE